MGTLYSVSSTDGSITTAGAITSTSTTLGFVPPKLSTTQRDATFTQASLLSQGITYTSILAGTVGNSYSVTVIDSGLGGLAYTEPAGAIVIDLGGSTSSISDVVTLIGTTTPSAFVTVSGSGITTIVTHSIESLSGGIQPVTGSQIYNTTTNVDNFFNGTVWTHVVDDQADYTIGGLFTYNKPPTLPMHSFASANSPVTADARITSLVDIDVDGDLTIDGPSNGVDGQKMTFRIVMGGTHTVTIASGAGNFRFGTDITSYTNSASGLTDYLGAIWNADDSRWDVVSVIQGF